MASTTYRPTKSTGSPTSSGSVTAPFTVHIRPVLILDNRNSPMLYSTYKTGIKTSPEVAMEYRPDKFSDLASLSIGKNLWTFLTTEESMIRMETAIDLGKPAVEAVAGRLVEEFGDDVRVDRVKQMIGHMVRQIMESRGYQLDAQNVKVLQDRRLFKKASRFRDGTSKTTQIGYVNRNNQRNLGTQGESGTDHNSSAYRLECLECHYFYLANGTDIFQRKCPKCQNGAPGINEHGVEK